MGGIRLQPDALWPPWRTAHQATALPLPQGPFLPAPISFVSGMAAPTRSRYSITAIGFDGKTYPSLTTITKRITGTHWSGPRFFGLTPKRKA